MSSETAPRGGVKGTGKGKSTGQNSDSTGKGAAKGGAKTRNGIANPKAEAKAKAKAKSEPKGATEPNPRGRPPAWAAPGGEPSGEEVQKRRRPGKRERSQGRGAGKGGASETTPTPPTRSGGVTFSPDTECREYDPSVGLARSGGVTVPGDAAVRDYDPAVGLLECTGLALPTGPFEAVPFTPAEADLRELSMGQGAQWLRGIRDPLELVDWEEPSNRAVWLQALEDTGGFRILASSSDHLGSWVRALVVHAAEQEHKTPIDRPWIAAQVQKALSYAARFGLPGIQQEAGALIGKEIERAGSLALPVVLHPPEPYAPGISRMYIDCGSIRLEAYDYGQKIFLGPEVADSVGVPEGTPEYHQCVLLGTRRPSS